MKRLFLLAAVSAFFVAAAFGSDVEFVYSGSQNYSLVERTDLRRYDNGKYIGLTSREVRSFIICENQIYDGHFYVSQDTVHNKKIVAQGIHDSIHSVFKIEKNGNLQMIEDNGFPSFRSFPTFPREKIAVGQSWQARAVRCVDPLNTGITRMPIEVQYTYLKDEVFRGEEVYVFSAKWATRYGDRHIDPEGDAALLKAVGGHNATMYIRKSDCAALVVQDRLDETYFYSDGRQVNFKGTISLFTEYPPAVDQTKLLPAIDRAKISAEDLPITSGNVRVEKTTGGIRLTIENLHFKPDSAELLPGEKILLDKIAAALSGIDQNKMLVEGHTASTGNPSGEMQLSVERAHSIAFELSKRGINPDLFICKGSGSTKPVADNSTKEGMAKNRRVEITILE